MQKPGLQPSDTIQGGLRTGCEKEDEQGDDLEHAVADKRKKERKKEHGIQKLHGFFCYNKKRFGDCKNERHGQVNSSTSTLTLRVIPKPPSCANTKTLALGACMCKPRHEV